MKKAFAFILILALLLLSGCKIKSYTPEIPLSFETNATVKSGDFSYDCKISKNDRCVTVTVLSTYAKDMVMIYDGKNLDFVYNSFSYQIDGSNFEKTNTAIVIYEVLDFINSATELNAKKIDGGYKYQGKISIGDFTLIQNDDNSLKSLSVPLAEYKIEFNNKK